MRRLAIALAALLLAAAASAQTAQPGPGVARELALKRAALIGELRYDVTLSIPATRDAPIQGTSAIRFDLASTAAPVVLDFDVERSRIDALEANGRPAKFEHVAGHLVVEASALAKGENTLRVRYRAGDAPLNRSDDFLFSLFVPARARQSLPVFDQPDLKARWRLTLEHPAEWQ
jgi:aminopeptidase N